MPHKQSCISRCDDRLKEMYVGALPTFNWVTIQVKSAGLYSETLHMYNTSFPSKPLYGFVMGVEFLWFAITMLFEVHLLAHVKGLDRQCLSNF